MERTHPESNSMLHSSARSDSILAPPQVITKSMQSLVADNGGRYAVIAAYILFAYMYTLTVLYGIWDLHQEEELGGTRADSSVFWNVVSTIVYTFFFVMMIVSHVLTVFTSPGQMPENYEKLHEEQIPKDFYQLISLRESIYAELVVKKKMRKGELSRASIPNFDQVVQSRRLSQSQRIESQVIAELEQEEEDEIVEGATNKSSPKNLHQAGHQQDVQQRLLHTNSVEPRQALDSDGEENEPDEDEVIMDYFVAQQKQANQSFDINLRRNTAVDRIVEKQCYTCNSLMPPYVYHCTTCRKCVVYMDHHCPWVNNCVGFYTQKLFFLFNLYGLITLGYSIVVLTRNFIYSAYGPQALNQKIDGICVTSAVSLFAVYLGFLFILVVFCDQITIILNRMTIFDRVRLENKRVSLKKIEKRGYENFKVTFGGPFSWRWFLPIAPKTVLSVEDLYN